MESKHQEHRMMLKRLTSIPICVLGVGLYRVWTETVYINSQYEFPTQQIGTYELFNVLIIGILICFALASKRIAPLSKIPKIFGLTGVLMVVSTLLNFISIVYPEYGTAFALPAAISGACGISLMMMLWSEFYGCINPFRTAIYLSLSIILGAMVLWVFKGLHFWWLFAGALLVPLVALGFLKQSLALLPEDERPRKSWGNFSFPWKPVLLVVLYSFAYGMREALFYSEVLGPHSSFGVILPAVLILFIVVMQKDVFSFKSIWIIALALMLLSLLPVDLHLPFAQRFGDFFALASYTACHILIIVVLSNLSYQYGVCALWIFSIERAARLAAVSLGLRAKEALGEYSALIGGDVVFNIVIAALVVLATILVLSEKELSSTWGIILNESPANEESVLLRNSLGTTCNKLAEKFELSQREEEILLLLAQKKKRSTIEKELFIATSTYKTHVRHIYQKLGIHSKAELYSLLGVE